MVTITGIRLQFQGGFAGRECELGILSNGTEQAQIEVTVTPLPFKFSAEDDNSLQEFQVNDLLKGTHFYLNFSSSTDFYGRIILYNFDIIGDI